MLQVVITTFLIWIIFGTAPFVVSAWLNLLDEFKVLKRKEVEVRERYFLYDLKERKWVETSKDPTGGSDE